MRAHIFALKNKSKKMETMFPSTSGSNHFGKALLMPNAPTAWQSGTCLGDQCAGQVKSLECQTTWGRSLDLKGMTTMVTQ